MFAVRTKEAVSELQLDWGGPGTDDETRRGHHSIRNVQDG